MSKKITEEQKRIALEEYAKSGNLSIAGQAAGVRRETLWAEKKRSKEFREAMDNARAVYCDNLERILDERIKAGCDGKDKASAILLIFKLKAEMPDKYRERVDHKIDANIRVLTNIPEPQKLDGE